MNESHVGGRQLITCSAYCRVRATRQGRPPLDNHTLHVARITNGVISEIWFHNRDQTAVDAFRS